MASFADAVSIRTLADGARVSSQNVFGVSGGQPPSSLDGRAEYAPDLVTGGSRSAPNDQDVLPPSERYGQRSDPGRETMWQLREFESGGARVL